MQIQIFDTYEDLSRAAANLVSAQLLIKPNSHIGLTAGKTPVGMFEELVRLYQSGTVSFSDAWFYNLEEVLCAGYPEFESFHSFFCQTLLEQVGCDPSHMVLPDSLTTDAQAECARYDARFAALPDGRLDLQILGIGADGHIGCNRPADALQVACHPVSLSQGRSGMAMGVQSNLLSKRLLLLANGEEKAQAIADLCSGTVTTACPATLLQLHPDVVVLLDRTAAFKLKCI